MTKSCFRLLLAAAALACAASVSMAYDHVAAVAESSWRATKKLLSDIAVGFVHAIAGPRDPQLQPRVRLVQARAFFGRLLRRERVQVTSGWRLCPSG